MRILLGLGDAELPETVAATHDPSVLRMSWDAKAAGISALRASEYSTIPSTAAHTGRRPGSKPENAGSSSAERICARPVGAKVGKEQPVTVPRSGVVADRRWHDELVGLAARIGSRDRLGRACSPQPLAAQHHRYRRRHPLPARVAIHRVESPGHRGDPSTSRQRRLQLGDLPERALRRHVASVEKGMHRHRHAGRRDQGRRGRDVPLVRVHSAWRRQPGKVRRATARLQSCDERAETRIRSEAAIGDGVVDARQVHPDDAPAPMLVCPTSELPIWPSGNPTSGPCAASCACGQVSQMRSKFGVRPSATALATDDGLSPHPSRMHSTTGRIAPPPPRPSASHIPPRRGWQIQVVRNTALPPPGNAAHFSTHHSPQTTHARRNRTSHPAPTVVENRSDMSGARPQTDIPHTFRGWRSGAA